MISRESRFRIIEMITRMTPSAIKRREAFTILLMSRFIEISITEKIYKVNRKELR